MKDPISIIEAAYRVDNSDSGWLAELAQTTARAMGHNQGVMAFQYDASSGDWIHIRNVAFERLPPEFVQRIFDQPEASLEQRKAFTRLYTSLSFGSLREKFVPVAPGIGVLLEHFGFEDLVGINALDPTARGCMIGVVAGKRRFPRRTVEVWRRLAAHVAAGNRLRRTLQALTQENVDPTTTAEAVLTPAGRVEHALDPAKPRAARTALCDALVGIHRARARNADPARAIDLWRALVSGRWSIVEHFERDGKRYYLAHKNDPELAEDRALTPRERQVLGYAELGHSDKLIAYELGLAPSTVSTLLSTARRKLGRSLELLRSSPK